MSAFAHYSLHAFSYLLQLLVRFFKHVLISKKRNLFKLSVILLIVFEVDVTIPMHKLQEGGSIVQTIFLHLVDYLCQD
jgi:hypothetical protein